MPHTRHKNYAVGDDAAAADSWLGTAPEPCVIGSRQGPVVASVDPTEVAGAAIGRDGGLAVASGSVGCTESAEPILFVPSTACGVAMPPTLGPWVDGTGCGAGTSGAGTSCGARTG